MNVLAKSDFSQQEVIKDLSYTTISSGLKQLLRNLISSPHSWNIETPYCLEETLFYKVEEFQEWNIFFPAW